MDGKDTKAGADTMVKRIEMDAGIKLEEINFEYFKVLEKMLLANPKTRLLLADRTEMMARYD